MDALLDGTEDLPSPKTSARSLPHLCEEPIWGVHQVLQYALWEASGIDRKCGAAEAVCCYQDVQKGQGQYLGHLQPSLSSEFRVLGPTI